MTTPERFTIELKSHYTDWWRYNVTLMCGCFNAEELRTDFASATSHLAEVGANLPAPPAERSAERTVTLTTSPCDHLILYLYIVPHTLPSNKAIDSTHPFEVEVHISCGGQHLRTERRQINQWSGASIEMRIDNQ